MFEIIGVASDAKYRSMREPMMPTVYKLSHEFRAFVLHVRTRGQPDRIILPVRRALAAVDPGVPFSEVRLLAEEVDASTAGERVTAILTSVFGTMAAVLTAVGLYGVLACAVAQRQREIGIRMALGAQTRDIGVFVGKQAFVLVVGGMLIGLIGALTGAHWVRSLLYGVAPWDPSSLTAAPVFVTLVCLVATAIPVARAVRIEPVAALRQPN
jgi:predicted lysophospholipase L1 biosynthesis ABC-type transport system permease subunit